MLDISVQNVKKAFEEGVDILDGITFDINEGERVGLLGKNGAGKTTLLRVITGEIESDEGNVIIPSYKKLGLISQIPIYPPQYTAEDVIRAALKPIKKIKRKMEELEVLMSKPSTNIDDKNNKILKEYDSLAFEFERLGGYNIEYEINRVINGLRIPETQREQLFSSLSGGEKTRINLARLIMENTDILLLDEPTNHLDLKATIWLEDFLVKFKGTVIIISHDRYFLDKVITRSIEISNGKAEFYTGNYSYYVTEKKRRYNEQLEIYKREQAEAKRLNEAADRLQQWGFGNKNLMKKSFALRTRAERAASTDKPIKDKKMKSAFSEREFRGDEVLIIRKLSKSFDNRKIIDIDELDVYAGERIAIIGDNGSGKTTLMKLIMGEEKQDTGIIKCGPSVRPAYLPQIIKFNTPNRNLVDTLIYDLNLTPQAARNRLGAFMFSGEDVYKLVGDLSGGEKSRLRLCMLMNADINLLLLDEPTNHLDLASREWIETALDGYSEALIFISHDRYFINRFATRIWSLENGEFKDFKGTYSAYTAALAASSETNMQKNTSQARQKEKQKPKKPADAQKEQRRLEREIEKLEAELSDISNLKEQHSSDYEKLLTLQEKEIHIQDLIDNLLEEWAIYIE